LNGSGKTTLLNAILLALYGNRMPLVSRLNLSYSELLSRFRSHGIESDEPSWVELDLGFETSTIQLRRSWHRAKVRMVDDLQIWRQGVPDPILAQSWASQVEQLIPGDWPPYFSSTENS